MIGYRTCFINTQATATQNLPEPAAEVLTVIGLAGGATSIAATTYTVTSSAPSTGQVQFTGTPESPSNTLTFSAALTANGVLMVMYRPVGTIEPSA